MKYGDHRELGDHEHDERRDRGASEVEEIGEDLDRGEEAEH